jgi:hypothetical protein
MLIHGNPVHSCPWEPRANLARSSMKLVHLYPRNLALRQPLATFLLGIFQNLPCGFYGLALCDVHLCEFKVHELRPRSNYKRDRPCAICKRDLDNRATSLHIIMSSCTPSMGTACLTLHTHPWEPRTSTSMSTLRCIMQLFDLDNFASYNHGL